LVSPSQVRLLTKAVKQQVKIDESPIGLPPANDAVHAFIIERLFEIELWWFSYD